MKGQIVADWRHVNCADREGRAQLFGALQYFLDGPIRRGRAQAQHFSGYSDFAQAALGVIDRAPGEGDYDAAFESVFDVIDMTASERNGFEILDVEDGLTFDEVAEGAKAKIYKCGGERVTVRFALYGAGLGWNRRLFEDREYWSVERNAVAFRKKWYAKRADMAYALIEAIPETRNEVWAAPSPAGLNAEDPNYEAVRDINTINAACGRILADLNEKGYAVTDRGGFTLLAPVALKARILRALGALNAGLAGPHQGVVYNVRPEFTMRLSAHDCYYVCVPGEKAIFADRQRLTVYDQFDPTSYSDIAVGWGRYGGVVGEPRQFVRCATEDAG
jgi:hypothetical protein